MNKKGFTLIELMGVVIVLSLLILIAIPVVDKYIKQTKVTAAEAQKDAVIMAAKNWASDNAENINPSATVTIDTLIELGYLDYDINLDNFKVDGDKLSVYNSVKITSQNGRFKYTLVASTISDSAPTNLRLYLVSSSVNSLTVRASATDSASSIVKYEFNIDGNKNSDGSLVWEGGTGASTYTFTDIIEGEHAVIFRVTNSSGKKTESKKYTFNTKEISRLNFVMKDIVEDCSSDTGIVRLIFPANSIDRSYTISGVETSVSTSSVDIDVAFNSVITASAQVDGVKIMETYNVSATNENGEEIDCFGGTE